MDHIAHISKQAIIKPEQSYNYKTRLVKDVIIFPLKKKQGLYLIKLNPHTQGCFVHVASMVAIGPVDQEKKILNAINLFLLLSSRPYLNKREFPFPTDVMC